MALWNTRDPILKERLFGLNGLEGNHGEDVKEEYYYLDATPTYSYARGLYKYPATEYPYGRLVRENQHRSRQLPELELVDTGAFDRNRYFDVQIEYAKAEPDDILIRIRITNHGPTVAPIHVLPTLWFRNTWSWGREPEPPPVCTAVPGPAGGLVLAEAEGAGGAAPRPASTTTDANPAVTSAALTSPADAAASATATASRVPTRPGPPASGAAKVEGDARICKVSIVGIGMKSHAGVAAKMFQVLSEEGINIQMISTSEIKTSVVIAEKYMELAVRALHKAFGLDAATV